MKVRQIIDFEERVLEISQGGATTYDELTDKTTVDLPTINTPLNNALNDKQKKLIAGSNITLLPDGTISAESNGVQSVTGDGVSGTPENITLTYPTPSEIGALDKIFTDYPDTSTMITSDQASQEDQVVYAVTDASDDANITFAPTETKRQAYYRYNGVATGSIDDYTLISAPYAIFLPKGEDIRGTAVEIIIEGGEPVDISQASHFNANVILNSVVTFTGLPPVGKSYTRTAVVISLTGTETLTFANSTNEFGSYDPTKVNFITIRVSNTSVAGLIVNVFYEQAN